MARKLDDLLKSEKLEIIEQAQQKASQMLLEIHLAELRQVMGVTQMEMAENLSISQPTVAGIEKPGNDIKLSTLKKYVESLGGKLNISVEVPNGKHYKFTV